MARVAFEDVGKVYPGGARAVSDFDLDVEDGEFMVLVGPSGCGKTTALRMVAGLEDITEGTVRIGDRVVNHVAAKDRDIAMVFQSYALYPHLKVYDNIAFGLRLRKEPKAEIDHRVRDAAETLGLTEYLDRRPGALSGGQRQRVAMGRAIVRRPQVFLMDEPLSNLDAKLRVQVRAQISQLQSDLGVTTIYVTHDQVEAMTMGDRVAVMRKGRLQQVASPQVVYDHPVNLFVAGFIGSPAMNILEARIEETEDGALRGPRRPAPRHRAPARGGAPGDQGVPGRGCGAGHPPREPGGRGPRAGRARRPAPARHGELREALGSEIVAYVRVPGTVPAVTDDVVELAEAVGAEEGPPGSDHGGGAVLVGRLGARSAAEEGGDIELVVNSDAFHFFDPGSGLAVYDERPRHGEVHDEGGETSTAPEPAVAAGADPGGGADGPGGRRLRWRRR